MDFEEWEPYYARILEDFGFSREEDERSAKVLDAKLGGDRIPLDALARVLLNQPVTVAGSAPGLGRGAPVRGAHGRDDAVPAVRAGVQLRGVHGRGPRRVPRGRDGRPLNPPRGVRLRQPEPQGRARPGGEAEAALGVHPGREADGGTAPG